MLQVLMEELLSAEAIALLTAVYNDETATLRKAGKNSETVCAPALRAKLAKYDAAIASLRDQVRAGLLPDDVAGPAIAAAESQRRAAVAESEVRTERRATEIVHVLPATAKTLARFLTRAMTDREFLEPAEILAAKRNLRGMLGSQPMPVDRGTEVRAKLRVKLDKNAAFLAASPKL